MDSTLTSSNWYWVLENIANATAPACYINLLDFLIIDTETHQPSKLYYTDKLGIVRCLPNERLTWSLVLKRFEKTHSFVLLRPGHASMETAFCSAIDLEGKEHLMSLQKFEKAFTKQLSSYMSFRCLRNYMARSLVRKLTLHIIYQNEMYFSIPYLREGTNKQPLEDIKLEKLLIIYATNIITALERSQNCRVSNIIIEFLQDAVSKLWVESCEVCDVNDIRSQASISGGRINMYSRVYKNLSASKASLSYSKLPSVYKLKINPKHETDKTIGCFMRSSSHCKLSRSFVKPRCEGSFCSFPMRINSLSKHNRIRASYFYMLNHELIEYVIKYIPLPTTEQVFSLEFGKLYSLHIQTRAKQNKKYLTDLDHKLAQIKYGKSRDMRLCGVCYRIYKLAANIELELDISQSY